MKSEVECEYPVKDVVDILTANKMNPVSMYFTRLIITLVRTVDIPDTMGNISQSTRKNLKNS
jgi:hypothetical protein